MGGKRMPQGMGRNIFGDARLQGPFIDDIPESLACHVRAEPGKKKIVASALFVQLQTYRREVVLRTNSVSPTEPTVPFPLRR
jgi:hypothetical protein